MKTRIKITRLGNLKTKFDITRIRSWNSSLFVVAKEAEINHLPDTDTGTWGYSDELLESLVKDDSDVHFNLAIINAPLEDDYYLRRVNNASAVISLYETSEIVQRNKFKSEDFVLLNIYTLLVAYQLEIDQHSSHELFHDDIRNCIFDFTGLKEDLIHSLLKPSLCDNCKSKINRTQTTNEFVPTIERELKKIKKDLYFRIEDWIKENPILSLLIAFGSGLLVNLISSIIFKLLIEPLLSNN